MTKFVSMSTRGFYTPEIHGENMPADAIQISDEAYADLIAGQSTGKVIDWSGDVPVLVDPPPPSEEHAADQCRKKRDQLLKEVYDPAVMLLLRMLRTAPEAQHAALAAKLAELDEYAVALQEVPEQPGFPNDVVWPTIPSKEL